MRLPLNTLTILLVVLVVCQVRGQELTHYEFLQMKAGSSITVPVKSAEYPSFLKIARHGVASKVKLNFEDQFRIKYTPEVDFTGLDTISYKTYRSESGDLIPYFEGFVVEVKPAIAVNDYAVMSLDHERLVFDVLGNDQFDANPVVSEIIHVSGGQAEVSGDGTGIEFQSAEVGVYFIKYQACADGVCAAATLTVRVNDQEELPVSDTAFYQIRRDASKVILLPPGFSPPSDRYYHGSLKEISEEQFRYTPELGFAGREELIFQKIYEGDLLTYRVVIDVIDHFNSNGWANKDHIYTEVDNSAVFSVLSNDLGHDIESLDVSQLKGALVEIDDGVFSYEPPPGFEGQTMFTYEVCGEGRCDEASAYITVSNYPPRSDQWTLYTTRNHELYLDYEVPIDDYHFITNVAPSRGIVKYDSDKKLLIYQPDEGFTGTDEVSVQYCTVNRGVDHCETLTLTVVVQDIETELCQHDCIWPGDLNHDGSVDLGDLLPLGANLGISGPAADVGISNGWYGRQANSWEGQRVVGSSDLKHVDADGNGTIGMGDLARIGRHYGKAHQIVAKPAPAMESIPLVVELKTPYVSAGEQAVVEVSLGDDAHEVAELIGVDFTILLNEHFVDSASFEFHLNEEGLFGLEKDALAEGISPRDGQFDVGIVSINPISITGHGVLGEIRFIVEEDLNGFRSLKDLLNIDVFVDRMRLLKSNGQYEGLPGAKGFFVFQKDPVTSEQKVTYFPNPSQSHLNIDGGQDQIIHVSVYDMRGGKVVDQTIGQSVERAIVDVSSLNSGSYIVQTVLSNGDVSVQQIQVITTR